MNPEESLTLTPKSYKNVLEKMFDYHSKTFIKNPYPITVYQIDRHDFEVETPEGRVEGKKGDYLVINPDGSMYPSNRKVFERNYTHYHISEENEPI